MTRSTILVFVLIVSAFVVTTANAQTTEFTYQGQLQASAMAASGNFDFEFVLFDATAGGSQVGATISRSGVVVAGGIFAVNLDFGSSFPGAGRFLEIRVKQAGGGAFTTLSPRQAITSSPYSVKSLNSDTATNAVNATTATAATNFTGTLAGDVTGTQTATTVTRLQTRNVANTAPLEGQVLKFNTANNRWQPDADNAGGGTINGVTAGTGLTGGGVNGSVTVGIANGGVGTGQLADGSVTDVKIVGVSGTKVTGPVSNATTALNFSGTLAGDVTGTQAATSIAANAITNTKLANGSVTDAKIVDLAGSKITGTIPVGAVPAGSGNYIQNQNAGPQAASNFNISGNGTAGGILSGNSVNSNSLYSIVGRPVLRAPGIGNLYVGLSSGEGSTFGQYNTFVGDILASNKTLGSFNSFFWSWRCDSNTTGQFNSYFGLRAGSAGINASSNSFFGLDSGGNNTGSFNSFIGRLAGFSNQSGSENTAVGYTANFGINNLINATAIGARSTVSQNNSLVLGSVNGINGATADTRVGIGTVAPVAKLTVAGSGAFSSTAAARFDLVNSSAGIGYFQHVGDTGLWQLATGSTSILIVNPSGDVGIGAAPNRKLEVNGRARISSIPLEASFGQVCFTAAGDLVQCGASSLRWKTNVQSYRSGLDVIQRLRPISYTWKESGAYDFGLGAEEVAKVDPTLAFIDSKGEVTGVKYEKMSMLLINAVKEQQTQIEVQVKQNNAQQRQIEQQRTEIDALRALVCRKNKSAAICKAAR